jgi:hypothetical protein
MVVKVHNGESFIKCKGITYSKEKETIKSLVEKHIREQASNAGTDATLSALISIAYEYELDDLVKELEEQLIKL